MFNISEFKSRINRHGGLARTSLFVVRLSPRNIPGIISTDDLRFFCQTITMPGVNLELMQYRPSGIGYTESMPMNATLDTLNGVFMLDSNHRVMSFFHNWINSIVNVSGNAGATRTGLERHEINYKENYATSMDIDFYSTHDPFKFYRCSYDGVYPTQVGSLTLNWSDNDAIATLPVNFSYNRMRYSGFENASFEQSRMFTSTQNSIAQNLNISQTIQGFDQRIIDTSALSLGIPVE